MYVLCLQYLMIKNLYSVSLQPSLLAIALLCFEAQEQHDPEHTDKISEALESLQRQLNVSANCLIFFDKYIIYLLD